MDARVDLTDQEPDASELLALADWRSRVVDLYADIRRSRDPATAWRRWCDVRADMFLHHSQSPLSAQAREKGRLPAYYDYSPDFRVVAGVVTAAPASSVTLPTSRGQTMPATLVARLAFTIAGAACELEAYWLAGYAGGLLVPFRDGTNGPQTWGSGRYVLDTAKGADLGWMDGGVVLDFNFAYQPSCSYDECWNCPIPPRANWLAPKVAAGERTAPQGKEIGAQ
jgi:uncharacterized protein